MINGEMVCDVHFTTLLERTRSRLWHNALFLTGNPFDADDLVQETYYRFLKLLYLQAAKEARNSPWTGYFIEVLFGHLMDRLPAIPFELLCDERGFCWWLVKFQNGVFEDLNRSQYFCSGMSMLGTSGPVEGM